MFRGGYSSARLLEKKTSNSYFANIQEDKDQRPLYRNAPRPMRDSSRFFRSGAPSTSSDLRDALWPRSRIRIDVSPECRQISGDEWLLSTKRPYAVCPADDPGCSAAANLRYATPFISRETNHQASSVLSGKSQKRSTNFANMRSGIMVVALSWNSISQERTTE